MNKADAKLLAILKKGNQLPIAEKYDYLLFQFLELHGVDFKQEIKDDENGYYLDANWTCKKCGKKFTKKLRLPDIQLRNLEHVLQVLRQLLCC